MIYSTSFMRKEFRNAYLQQSFSSKRQLSLGVFLGLITFAVYFCLQTLSRSVLVDAVPYIMMSSYFSTLYIYLYVSLIFNVSLFISKYEYMSFIEILRNRWYPLVQLGYKPTRLILTKVLVRVMAQAYIYVIGFAVTMFLSSFLKFPLVLGYIVSLFLVGLMDIILLSVVSLAASLLCKNVVNAKYVVALLGVGILVLKSVTGYNTILTDRTLMVDVLNLFDATQSIYMVSAAVVVVGGVILCVVRGGRQARVFNPPMLSELPKLQNRGEDTVVLARADSRKRRSDITASARHMASYRRFNLPAILTNLVLICAIVVMLGMNAVVLACSYASPEKETSIFGLIPYVFQSSTMEPDIMFNDLAFFEKVDVQYPVKEGDMVIFKDAVEAVGVSRIKEFVVEEETGETKINVDVDTYADERYRGAAAQTITRGQIYGVFYGTNRWMGALILFANTILGRIILLLIPTFLIFFYDSIVHLTKSLNREQVPQHVALTLEEDAEMKRKKK